MACLLKLIFYINEPVADCNDGDNCGQTTVIQLGVWRCSY